MVVIKIIVFTYALSGSVYRGVVCTRYKSKPTWEEQIKHYVQFCYNATSQSLLYFEWGDLETMETVYTYEDLETILQNYIELVDPEVMVHCAHPNICDDSFMIRGHDARLFLSPPVDLPQGGDEKC